MNQSDFECVVEECIARCAKTLDIKAEEYSTDDRLHNFKAAARLQGCTPERALLGMWAKHIVSVVDIVRDIEAGKLPPEDLVHEKLTDVMNYVMLLEALIDERMGGMP